VAADVGVGVVVGVVVGLGLVPPDVKLFTGARLRHVPCTLYATK
jgi:hypothetical protein